MSEDISYFLAFPSLGVIIVSEMIDDIPSTSGRHHALTNYYHTMSGAASKQEWDEAAAWGSG